MRKIKLSQLLKAGISALIIFYLLSLVDLPLLKTTIQQARLPFVVIALLMIFLNLLISSYRWLLILNKDNKFLNYKEAIEVCLAGASLNIFMPASTGDLAKSYYGYRWFGIKEEVISTSFIDKVAGAFSLFSIATLSALLFGFYNLAIGFFMIALLVSLIFFMPKLIPWNFLNRLVIKLFKKGFDTNKLQVASNLSNSRKLVLVAISTLAWGIGFTELYFIYSVFTDRVSFPFVLIVGPLTNLAYLLPFTLNGLGSSDAVVVYALTYIKIAATIGVMTAFFHRLIAIIPGLIGWFLIVFKKRHSRRSTPVI